MGEAVAGLSKYITVTGVSLTVTSCLPAVPPRFVAPRRMVKRAFPVPWFEHSKEQSILNRLEELAGVIVNRNPGEATKVVLVVVSELAKVACVMLRIRPLPPAPLEAAVIRPLPSTVISADV